MPFKLQKTFKPPYKHIEKTVDAANYRQDKNWQEGKEFQVMRPLM